MLLGLRKGTPIKLVVLDWEDTLFPFSFGKPEIQDGPDGTTESMKNVLSNIEEAAIELLQKLKERYGPSLVVRLVWRSLHTVQELQKHMPQLSATFATWPNFSYINNVYLVGMQTLLASVERPLFLTIITSDNELLRAAQMAVQTTNQVHLVLAPVPSILPTRLASNLRRLSSWTHI